jgi:hypothetical protein
MYQIAERFTRVLIDMLHRCLILVLVLLAAACVSPVAGDPQGQLALPSSAAIASPASATSRVPANILSAATRPVTLPVASATGVGQGLITRITPSIAPTRIALSTTLPLSATSPLSSTSGKQPDNPSGGVRFAVIGDYGLSISSGESRVARLVQSWRPDFIITVGDNNYTEGAATTIDQNIGQYYHDFIYPYSGAYGIGADENHFFPTLGNHDWNTPGAQPYLDYFELPGNERYYDFIWGPVHFFAVDSDTREPDGTSSTSTQAQWLKKTLASSTSCWNLVYFHHPPFSSGPHQASTWMRWPFKAWGADAVLSGHDHIYERILRDGIPYFIDGLGGGTRYQLGTPTAGSQVRYQADFGAMRVTASPATITYEFVTAKGLVIDTYTQSGRCQGD